MILLPSQLFSTIVSAPAARRGRRGRFRRDRTSPGPHTAISRAACRDRRRIEIGGEADDVPPAHRIARRVVVEISFDVSEGVATAPVVSRRRCGFDGSGIGDGEELRPRSGRRGSRSSWQQQLLGVERRSVDRRRFGTRPALSSYAAMKKYALTLHCPTRPCRAAARCPGSPPRGSSGAHQRDTPVNGLAKPVPEPVAGMWSTRSRRPARPY
jgi:hypothetical protein